MVPSALHQQEAHEPCGARQRSAARLQAAVDRGHLVWPSEVTVERLDAPEQHRHGPQASGAKPDAPDSRAGERKPSGGMVPLDIAEHLTFERTTPRLVSHTGRR